MKTELDIQVTVIGAAIMALMPYTLAKPPAYTPFSYYRNVENVSGGSAHIRENGKQLVHVKTLVHVGMRKDVIDIYRTNMLKLKDRFQLHPLCRWVFQWMFNIA